MKCRCSGLQGLDLLVCLAPPKGEYETQVKLSENLSIVVNREGVYIRRVATDDFLPFINTIDREVRRLETLKAYNVSIERLLCENIRNLHQAAEHGSEYARRLIEECGDMIKKILDSECKRID